MPDFENDLLVLLSDVARHMRTYGNQLAQQHGMTFAAGRAALDAMITQQAQIIAYIDDCKLLMIAMLAMIPLLVVFTKSARPAGNHVVKL
jgi:DHA2 family multidrug resistance protein